MPKQKHIRGLNAQITDPAELAIAKDKLLLLAQSESVPVEFKEHQSGITVELSCRIAGYLPFIGPDGIIRSTERIQRLAEISSQTKHTIILYSCHQLAKLF